jgi:hypothetical protein
MKNIQKLINRLYQYHFAVGYNACSDTDLIPEDDMEGTLISDLQEAGVSMEQIQFVIMKAVNDGEEKAIWGDKKEGFAL